MISKTHHSVKNKKSKPNKQFVEYGTDLPIFKHKDEIVDILKREGKLIICGQTGCGKTTQVPKYIYQNNLNKNKMIAVTQPRRVAAVTISQRVAKELDTKLGNKVGYSIRFDKKVSENTKIEYLTDGMLLREAILDPLLSKYSVIVLDEVHERTVNTDVLLSIIKNINRSDLIIVVMSATIDIPKISTYFEIDSVVNVEGRTFPVEIYNMAESEGNYIDNALIAILQTHLDQPEGDILWFLTGQEDIEDLQSLLEEKVELGKDEKYKMPELVVVPLYANLPNHLQLKAFEKVEGRKVILWTNIAETSLTINGIRYIIDTGLCKIKSFQATTGIEALKITAISKNSAVQRAGRAGREAPGKWFRLYSEDIYNEMETSTVPEILRTNLSRVIIQLKAMGIENVTDFDFMDKPKKQLFIKAFKELSDLKWLDSNANLNELGRQMSIIPTEPIFSKLLIHSLKDEFKPITEDIWIIVAMLSVENIFFTPRANKRKAERKHKKFIWSYSDHLTLLNVYRSALLNSDSQIFNKEDQINLSSELNISSSKNKCSKEYWRENFINEKSINKAIQINKQLMSYLQSISLSMSKPKKSNDDFEEQKLDLSKQELFGVENQQFGDKNELILKCLYEGLPLNIADNHFGVLYKTSKSSEDCRIHPTSVLFNSTPAHIIYTEIIVTSKKYMRFVSDITSVFVKNSI